MSLLLKRFEKRSVTREVPCSQKFFVIEKVSNDYIVEMKHSPLCLFHINKNDKSILNITIVYLSFYVFSLHMSNTIMYHFYGCTSGESTPLFCYEET